jgi:hypothetical protein
MKLKCWRCQHLICTEVILVFKTKSPETRHESDIIIGKTALLEPQPSLEFSLLWISQQRKVVSLACNPHPGGPGLCIHVPQ